MKKYKVYCLKDSTGKIQYIGQTKQSLSKRFYGHRCDKKRPTKDFTIHLIDSFDTTYEMYALETKLIEELDLVNNGWNREYGKLKVPKQHDASGSNNGFYKMSHRQEIRDRIGKRSIGNSYAKGSKSRRGQKNTDEHNKLISLKHKVKVYCHQLDVVFFSMEDAAIHLKVHQSKVSAVCRKERRHTKNYTFSYYK